MAANESFPLAAPAHDAAARELEAVLEQMSSLGQPGAARLRTSPPSALRNAAVQPRVAGGGVPPAAGAPDARPTSWDEQALRAVLESVPDAVIAADARGTMVLVNRQAEQLFGYSRAELLGRPVEMLMPERFRAAHVAQRTGYFADPKIRPMGAELDLWARRKDGEEFPVEISLSPLPTPAGLLVTTTVRDISLRRQNEDQLRHAEARYRTLVEEIPAVTFMAALDDTAAAINELYVSPQIESLLGFTQKEWLEDPVLWYRQLHPEDRDRWHVEFARTCSTAEPFESVYRFVARDGRVVWVHGHAKVVRDQQGRPLFLQGVAFDITERKRAEEALSQLNQTLKQRVDEAVAETIAKMHELARSNRELDDFASFASHDLREVLRTMHRNMQLLERQHAQSMDESARDYVAKAQTGARHMERLILDLHSHSRLGREGEAGPVDCGEVLTQTQASLEAALEESRAVITADPLPKVQAVRSEMVLLFQNLLQNAIKYRADRPPAIQIGARSYDAGQWLFWIRDNGIGIEPGYFAKIFELGDRGPHRRSSKYAGTGFGLANCRKIVERHGGRIWVASKPGVGSTFYFLLPAVT